MLLDAGHTASVLDGKKISSQWQADLLGRAADVTTGLGRPPGLGVVLVGSRPDSRIYVQRKQEACAKVRSRKSMLMCQPPPPACFHSCRSASRWCIKRFQTLFLKQMWNQQSKLPAMTNL